MEPTAPHIPLFFFLHIPKTAGTTFKDILRRNFGPGYEEEYGLLVDFTYSAAQVTAMIERYPSLRCLSSHRISLDLPWDRANCSLRAISFIRDPAERFASHYFFTRSILTTFHKKTKVADPARVSAMGGRRGKQQPVRERSDPAACGRCRRCGARRDRGACRGGAARAFPD